MMAKMKRREESLASIVLETVLLKAVQANEV
jgi:hypothetical protein